VAQYVPDPPGLPPHDLIEEMGAELAARFAGAEDELIRQVAVRAHRDLALQEIVRTTAMDEHMGSLFSRALARNRALAELAAHRAQTIRDLQFSAVQVAGKLKAKQTAIDVITLAWQEGEGAAAARLGMAKRLPATSALNGTSSQAATMLTMDLTSRLEDMALRIARYPQDAYQRIISLTASNTLLGTTTSLRMQQASVQRFLSEGITGFVDKADRHWRIGSYAEMAGRTAVNRAYNDAGVWRMQQSGVNLVTVQGGLDSCPQCAPWVGRILSTDGSTGDVEVQHATEDRTVIVTVAATLDTARGAGLMHPNAILGNQTVRPLGAVENGVKAWYDGPSVHVTCASGVQLTVSPNHPVLTPDGWVAADTLKEGMHVFSAADGHGDGLPGSADEDLNKAAPRFEDVLDAVAAVGGRTSIPSSADYLHGDGRFIQGEIDVVFADGSLVTELHSGLLQEPCEHFLVRPYVQAEAGAGIGSPDQGGLAVLGPVARPLANDYSAGVEPSSDGRVADAETVGEILSGLSAGVALDQIVKVEHGSYVGHAFDLQTGSGAYLAGSILVHNCRHKAVAYLPGLSIPQAGQEYNAEADAARTQQRSIERDIRKAKREQSVAGDPAAKQRAGAKVKAKQAQMRDHLEATGRKRASFREQLSFADG